MTTQLDDPLLTQEKINFFEKNGFVHLEDVLSNDEVDELAESMEESMRIKDGQGVKTDQVGGSYYKVLNQKVNNWRDHGGMAKYSFHPKLAQIALKLSKSTGIRLFHDHALWKMPGDSKPTPWHQDAPYWPMQQTGGLSAWIPVHDVDEHNGCMMFVPGSHKYGKLTGIDLINPQNIFDYIDNSDQARKSAVEVPLKKGSCTFHHGLTFHYAHANASDQPRRVLAIIYMPDGTTFSGAEHPVTDGLGLNKGEVLRGGLFPLLAKC